MKIRRFILLILSFFLFLAVASYSPNDAAILSGGVEGIPVNWLGKCGAFSGMILFYCFGLAAYLVPFFFLLRCIRCFYPAPAKGGIFFTALALVLLGSILLLGLNPQNYVGITNYLGLGHRQSPELALAGGAFGQILAAPQVPELYLPEGIVRQYIGVVGTTLTGLFLLLGGLILAYVTDYHRLLYGKLPSLTKLAEKITPEVEEKVVPAIHEQLALPEEEENPKSVKSSWLDKLKRAKAPVNDGESKANDGLDDIPEVLDINPDPGRNMISPDPAQALTEILHPQSAPEPAVPAPEKVPEVPAIVPQAPVRTGELEITPTASGENAKPSLFRQYTVPPVTMLSAGGENQSEDLREIERCRSAIQSTLDSFEIPGQVSGYITGPRITRYEITLEPGVSVKKIVQIESNIAMALSAERVRVLAPIPGRSVVGIEVSNTRSQAVHMRSVMESAAWLNSKAEIPLAVGKDVSGNPVIFDLGKAPHLLIAGTTGTGKSVCTNSLIISLLFKFRPDELKLIMVDPKIVEFEDYKRLPHLLTPIINQYDQVPIALRWAVNEMEKRYRTMARAGVKKLIEYNTRPLTGTPVIGDNGEPIPDRMPYLVVIVDELADLMTTEAKKDAENAIQRIAQKGRAAGIHLILATQRPSTDVITGVIKGNLPSRFCFQVRSVTDSRVVIDTGGAEKLLGRGDMLLLSSTSMVIERVQGAFVEDRDIKKVVEFISDQMPQSFDDTVLKEEQSEDSVREPESSRAFDDSDVFDEMDYAEIEPVLQKYLKPGDSPTFKDALRVILLDKQASTSYLQRRLKIGYNRAAEITDELERRGIIGPATGSGNKREILIFDMLQVNNN